MQWCNTTTQNSSRGKTLGHPRWILAPVNEIHCLLLLLQEEYWLQLMRFIAYYYYYYRYAWSLIMYITAHLSTYSPLGTGKISNDSNGVSVSEPDQLWSTAILFVCEHTCTFMFMYVYSGVQFYITFCMACNLIHTIMYQLQTGWDTRDEFADPLNGFNNTQCTCAARVMAKPAPLLHDNSLPSPLWSAVRPVKHCTRSWHHHPTAFTMEDQKATGRHHKEDWDATDNPGTQLTSKPPDLLAVETAHATTIPQQFPCTSQSVIISWMEGSWATICVILASPGHKSTTRRGERGLCCVGWLYSISYEALGCVATDFNLQSILNIGDT